MFFMPHGGPESFASLAASFAASDSASTTMELSVAASTPVSWEASGMVVSALLSTISSCASLPLASIVPSTWPPAPVPEALNCPKLLVHAAKPSAMLATTAAAR
jgi:hypothetical protein